MKVYRQSGQILLEALHEGLEATLELFDLILLLLELERA